MTFTEFVGQHPALFFYGSITLLVVVAVVLAFALGVMTKGDDAS